MSYFKPGDPLDRVFEIAILLKGLDGILETIGGLLLLLISPSTINRLVAALTQHELSEDPHDFMATHLLNTTHGLSQSALSFSALTCSSTDS